MNMRNLVLAVGIIGLFSSTAMAGWTGDSIQIDVVNLNTQPTPLRTATISVPGTTNFANSGNLTVDLSASQVTLRPTIADASSFFPPGALFSGVTFTDLAANSPGIVNFSFNPGLSTVLVSGAFGTSFTGSTLSIDVRGVSEPTGWTAVFDVAFEAPEPMSIALLATGLSGLAAVTRRTRRKAC